MISVVIPTLNAAAGLPSALNALIPGVVSGIIRELIVVDGGSNDQTVEIAEAAGANVIKSECGRGNQLKTGADAAKGSWLLFLHADTRLETGWEKEVVLFIEQNETGGRPVTAAAFRFNLDDRGLMPRLVEWGVAWRCTLLGMPYGDQALLISRELYNDVGGYTPIPLFEDVDINRRIGRFRLKILRSAAITSAARYQRKGYLQRITRNSLCLLLYCCRVPPHRIVQLYS